MLLLGDSVEREMLVDINETARSANSKGHATLLNEHWRVALKLPHIEMVRFVRTVLLQQLCSLTSVGSTMLWRGAGLSVRSREPHDRPVSRRRAVEHDHRQCAAQGEERRELQPTVAVAAQLYDLQMFLQGFELHQILTGRAFPNIVVFSNVLWDLGRWFFLSEIAEPER